MAYEQECPECGKCAGWTTVGVDKRYDFVTLEDGSVSVGYRNNRAQGQKLWMQCNSLDCDAVRPVYISVSVEAFGPVEVRGGEVQETLVS